MQVTQMPYPNSIPFSEIKTMLEIVKSGNIKASANSLAYNAWIVQGYAQSCVFGDPNMLLSKQDAEDPNSVDPIDVLEKLVATEDQLNVQLSIPWDVLLKYATQMILAALQAKLAA